MIAHTAPICLISSKVENCLPIAYQLSSVVVSCKLGSFNIQTLLGKNHPAIAIYTYSSTYFFMQTPPSTPVAFVVNLDRQPDRWQAIQRQASDTNCPIHRVPAVDMHTMDTEKYRSDFIRNPKYYWSEGDIACTLSHLKAIKLFLETNQPWCCILEDDLTLTKAFSDLMRDDANILGDLGLDCLKVEYIPTSNSTKSKPFGRFLQATRYGNAFSLNSTCIGAGAYLLSRNGALKIIDHLCPVEVPIDQLLFNRRYKLGTRLLRMGFLEHGLVRHNIDTVKSGIISNRKKSTLLSRRRLLNEFHKSIERLRCYSLALLKIHERVKIKPNSELSKR